MINLYISHEEFISINNVLKEYYEMKEEIKKFCNFCGIFYIKSVKNYCVSHKKYAANENWRVAKTKQNRLCFYQVGLFVARENQFLLRIKNFQMIRSKSIKSVTNFYWLETT